MAKSYQLNKKKEILPKKFLYLKDILLIKSRYRRPGSGQG